MPELAVKPLAKARTRKKPQWVTDFKAIPLDDVKLWGWPDLSLAPGDLNNSADTFHVKVKVRPALLHVVDQFLEVTVRCTDLSRIGKPGSVETQTFFVDTSRAGEYLRTFHVTVIDDAVWDPDFDNEVEVTIDPLGTFPDADRSNNTLRMWGTTVG